MLVCAGWSGRAPRLDGHGRGPTDRFSGAVFWVNRAGHQGDPPRTRVCRFGRTSFIVIVLRADPDPRSRQSVLVVLPGSAASDFHGRPFS